VKRILLVALLLSMALAVAGCGERGEQGNTGGGQGGQSYAGDVSDETYYWISQNSTLPLFVANDHPALQKAADQLGVKVEIVGPTNIDLPAFISTINQTCARKPAGVMIVGWDPSLTQPTNQCMEQGVPTVTVDADLPESERMTFVGTDWYNIGVAQAQAMIEATGGEGKVATLSIINADNMKQARQGFQDTLRGTDIEIVAEEDDGGDASQAAQKTAALLSANSDLAGIGGFDSESGAGIVRALEEANKVGDVKVTAMEQSPEFFNTVKDGSVDAIIIQKRALFTYYGLKTLFDYNHSGVSILGLPKEEAPPIPQDIDTGLVVATKDNIDSILEAVEKQEK
jgi:ABC-type sugar transport system substrate-binding protein